MKIAAGEFKAKCLKLMDTVQKYHEEIIITKHGKPIARLCSIDEVPNKSLFGYMKNSVIIKGNIVDPIDEKWDVDG